ncbi:GNAT family N-acetyltransferase [Streptomyces sp. NPDC046985]|uniref:GNAT family N-acetyltransferase n=1 Tax=Streptomyces sp. NPDC046985 TaxID=3155377 RepID=UPI0033F33557
MPPTDARAADRVPAPTAQAHAATPDPDAEDTLHLRLPDGFHAPLTAPAPAPAATAPAPAPAAPTAPAPSGVAPPPSSAPPAARDLLDGVGQWGPTATPAGAFQLVPVRLDRDLPLVSRWMNDPAVAEFWQLAGERSVTEDHLRVQADGDGRSVPCLGLLDGTPMSYWEIYRADLDPLTRSYPARPHDTGVHLLLGAAADRGRGLGTALIRAVTGLILGNRPACARVVAEPDVRNAPSVAAFRSAGFRCAAETDLPGKRAALMIRDRTRSVPL